MKIAHLSFSFLPQIGGAEIFVHNLAHQQHQAGHKVTVITAWNYWSEIKGNVPYKVRPLLPKTLQMILKAQQSGYDIRWIVNAQLATYQILSHFDIWHIHMAHPAGVGTVSMLKTMKIPSILSSYGGDIQTLPEIGYGNRLDAQIEKDLVHALPMLDRVVAISSGMRTEFLNLRVSSEKIHNIPTGVNVSRIAELLVNRESVRAKMRWPSKKKILLTVGRNHPVKGYRYIPPIIQQLAKVRQDFLWVLAADNSEPILEMAKQMGIESFLQIVLQNQKNTFPDQPFMRPTNELIEIYKTADILVFPSLLEGMPLVLIEAMAAGLPIVTTDAPGCRDAVEAEVSGLISSVGDVLGMTKNILRLMDDTGLRSQLVKNAKEQVVQFDLKNVARQYHELYEELLSTSMVTPYSHLTSPTRREQ